MPVMTAPAPRFGCWTILLLMVVAGCAGTHFHAAAAPGGDAARLDPAMLSGQEYWCGIVFNGEKIGFSHFLLTPAPDDPGAFDIESEAVFSFRFLMVEKRFALRANDRVQKDLSLVRFTHDYDMDGTKMRLSGESEDGTVRVRVVTSGEETVQEHPVHGPVFPTSVIYLYPAVHGLEIGRTYEYPVYSGETRSMAQVSQEVLAYEQSDLFEGGGFKLKTLLQGQEVTSWVDVSGRPLLEMALGGVMISGLEEREKAQQYLVRSSLNRNETLLDFSLIRTDRAIPDPRQARYLELALAGLDPAMKVISDARQRCAWEGGRLVCRIDAERDVPVPAGAGPADMKPFLRSTLAAPASNERIRTLARTVSKDREDPMDKVRAILAWIGDNISREPIDVFTALDVLERGGAECQGHAVLYAALARASGIPTKVVNGIVYSAEHGGFLYHTWAESCVGNTWVSVDPTFSQVRADATHVKVVEGENPDDLIPLVGMIGRVSAEIVTWH